MSILDVITLVIFGILPVLYIIGRFIEDDF